MTRPGYVYPKKRADGLCAVCLTAPTVAPRAIYCSPECKRIAVRVVRQQVAAQSRQLVQCGSWLCSQTFYTDGYRVYCSAECGDVMEHVATRPESAVATAIRLGIVNASLVYFRQCIDCGAWECRRTPVTKRLRCARCKAAWHRNRSLVKAHSKRAFGKVPTVDQLAARDGTLCHICRKRIDLTLPSTHKHGPTIEHILPVSLGGTNDHDNLALAHRQCNQRRGNRGHSQMLLVST